MNSIITRGVVFFLLSLSLTSGQVHACDTKSGKVCARSVAHKSESKVKLGKYGAPAGNVGAVAVAGGVMPLGHANTLLGPQGAGGQAMPGVTITDTVAYQLNGRTLNQVEASKLVSDTSLVPNARDGALSDKALAMGYTRVVAPTAVLARPSIVTTTYNYFLTRNGQTVALTPNQIDALRRSGFILPDGQLRPESLGRGFSAVAQHSYATPPPPRQVVAPNLRSTSVAAAQSANPTSSSSSHGAGLSGNDVSLQATHPNAVVEVYQPTEGTLYTHGEARFITNDDFHLVVIGYKEPQR